MNQTVTAGAAKQVSDHFPWILYLTDLPIRKTGLRLSIRMFVVALLVSGITGTAASAAGSTSGSSFVAPRQEAPQEPAPPTEGMDALPPPTETLQLWPSQPPGDQETKLPPEADQSNADSRRVAGKYVIRLGNVSKPELAIYRPAADKDTCQSVIICPGGGYHILAYDLEGTEVAQWLNTQGITGIVLKYRVPARADQPRWQAAVQDVQRAISTVRHNAAGWNLDPDKIGVLGFSAGGHAAGMASLLQNNRKYEPQDAIDEQSCAPNFSVLIYPAYLVDAETGQMNDELAIPDAMGPVFLVHAWDDPVTPLTSIVLAAELKKKEVPVELHLYNKGGHGYGMRKTELPVSRWTELCEPWLQDLGKAP